MSIYSINPANSPVIAQVSGSTFIATSGSVGAVVIGGTIGTGTFADVNSSVSTDDLSTGSDALVTQAFNYGFNQANGQWTRIFSVPTRSGVKSTTMPTSGFALLTATRIVGTTEIADVFDSAEDDMKAADVVLQVGARTYGYNRESGSASGSFWPRIDAILQRSTDDFVRWKAADSGVGLRTFTQIMGYDDDISQVFTLDSDDAFGDKGLFVKSHNSAWVDSSGTWVRLRATQSGQGMSGIPHKLAVAFSGDIAQIGEGGQIVQVDTANSDNLSDGNSALDTLAFNLGFNDQTDNWGRLRAFALSSGQTQSFSTTLPFSGYVLGTAALLTDVGGRIGNMGDTDDDAKGITENALDTNSITRAFHEASSTLVRVRGIAVSSGMDSSPGIRMPFSGYVLGTTSFIVGRGGNLAEVDDPDGDDEPVSDSALEVKGFNYAFNQPLNEFVRLRATSSGAAFSGIHHKLAVAFSGDIVQIGEGGNVVDVAGAGTDVMSNADNALTTTDRLNAYDQSGDVFRRIRGIGTQSGGIDFAMYVKPQEPQSFVVVSRAAVATSGGHFLAIYHAGGADVVVKIKDIHIINDGVSPASGERFFFELAKFSFAPTGGTTTSATALDTRNNLSGVALTIRLFPTNMSGNGMTAIRDLVTLTQGWETPTVSFNSGMTTLGIVPSLLQLANLAPHEDGTQPLTLTSGHGASIWQPVFYGVRTSGRFGFFVTYTVEPY